MRGGEPRTIGLGLWSGEGHCAHGALRARGGYFLLHEERGQSVTMVDVYGEEGPRVTARGQIAPTSGCVAMICVFSPVRVELWSCGRQNAHMKKFSRNPRACGGTRLGGGSQVEVR